MSVRTCKRELDAVDFANWKAMYRLEPWGDEQRMAAMICAAVRNSQRTGGTAFKIGDWIKSDWEAEEMSDAEIQASFNLFFSTLGG